MAYFVSVRNVPKILCGRFFHTSFASSQGSGLAKLRKLTGYSMSNCKKALELYPEDVEKAQEWLHNEAKKQGWAKIVSLEQRSALQGLVGVQVKGSIAAMVEVNCETDFVARNAEFQAFVLKVLTSCLNHTVAETSGEECRKLHLDSNSLNNLEVDSCSLGDLTASAIGKFGEKTVIRRAVCFKVGDNVHLCSFSHPPLQSISIPDGALGKYGGLVAYRQTEILPEVDNDKLDEIGKQLSKHIVGMNPETLGTMPPDAPETGDELKLEDTSYTVKKLEVDHKEDIVVNEQSLGENVAEGDEDSQHDDDDDKKIDTNETRLLQQQFLLEPTITVAELLKKNSLEVIDFQRYECGEPDVTLK